MESPFRFSFLIPLCAILLSACSSDKIDEQRDNHLPIDFRVSSTLSNLRIEAVTQDSLGYLWFGTYRGLNRYNGHQMSQYFCDDTPHSLPDNQVWAVFTDQGGRIWVATKNGVAYHTKDDDFVHVPTPDNSNFGQEFAQNHRGDLFLLQAHQVARFDSASHTFRQVIDDVGSTAYINNDMYIDSSDMLWIVNEQRVSCYNSYTFQRQDIIDCSNWSINRSCLWGDQLWLSHQDQIRRYDVIHHQWLPLPAVFASHPLFRSTYIECMQPTPQGHLLISTRSGIFDYDPVARTLVHQSEAAFPFEAPGFVVRHIFCDNEQNLWLCSESQGFVVRSQSRQRFNSDNYLRSTFSGEPVASIALGMQSRLWIATQQHGLYSYHLPTHAIRHYDLPDIEARLHGEQLRIYTVFADSQGDIWLGCLPSGVLQLRPKGQQLSLVASYDLLLPITIGEDAQGTIWIGAYNNSYYSHRPGDSHFREHRILTNTFTYTSCFVPLADGRMAALTKGQGLRLIDSLRHEMQAPVFPDSMLDACISRSTFLPSCLLQDRKGDLWIGTVSNGLLHYDMQCRQLTAIPGAPCDDISSLEQDLEGNLWVSTQDGLGQLNPETRTFINYFKSDGIGGNEFYDRASCRLPDGTLIFGGAHGLTVFNPADLNDDLHPRLYFENLKIDNRIVRPNQSRSLQGALHSAPEVRLNYNQTNFSLSFAVLDFSDSKRYNYQYRLEGFNTQWVDANLTQEAFYANLDPGCYTFHVRAISKDQQRIIAERSLPIHILPAPWATPWAWLLYIVAALAMGGYIFRLIRRIRTERRNRLLTEREKEHERRINRMNMSFFANVSHEFRTPLTLISAPITQLVADRQLPAETHSLLCVMQRSVNRMLRLVNQMMDFHKLEDDALRLEVQRQDLIQLLRQTAEVFHLQAREKKIRFRTYGMEDNCLLWIDADKVEKIIYNLLGNAVKYAPSGGSIDLSFDATPQHVHISVADSGQGIPKDQLTRIFERYYQLRRQEQGLFNWGTGIGLYYALKLAQLHHGDIVAKNRTDGPGSIFTVTLPALESAYSDTEKTQQQTTQSAAYPLPPSPIEPGIEIEVGDNSSGRIPESNRTLETDRAFESNTTSESDNIFESDNNSKSNNSSESDKPTQPLILVIDDDIEIVHYVKLLLQGTYQVVGRFDAESGLEAIHQKAPDIILCDVSMPGRDGYDLCHQVKNDLQLCHIPVVLLTARTSTSDMVQGLGVGGDAYVTKPFDPSYLLALIESILRNREKIRHLLSASTQTEALEGDVLSSQDKAFMTELYKIMEQELANPDLDVSHMTGLIHVSRSKLYYKIKGLTGESPSVFFRQYKLNRAAEMIREGQYNISEISYLTGFSTLSHFSTSFKRQFGVTPSEY